MNLERLTVLSLVSACAAALLLSEPLGANATRQGDGILAQEPMHLGSTVSPNFIMAIDDSGSMTFQTLFPGADGEACFKDGSFFSGTTLRTDGSCEYYYVLPGPRVNNYHGIPPFDAFGFARSPDINPSFFDPDRTYDPWINSNLVSYGNASLTATKIDPRGTDTINLFAENFSKDFDDLFVVRTGMYIPSGIKYSRNDGQCLTYDKKGNCTSRAWVDRTSSGFTWTDPDERIAIAYVPAAVYLKANRTITGYTAPVKIAGACGTNCDLYKYVPDTTTTKQNFANWFSYYGNRNRAMVAGLTRSLIDVSNLHVGYFTINSGGGSYAYGDVSMRDINDVTQKKALFTDVLKLPASGGTPNRFAVEHIGKQFNTNTNIIKHACQKNAGMLFTDGFSNQAGPTGYNNADGAMGAPFSDAHDNTLADIASYFYNNTLRSGAFTEGRVPASNPTVCETGTAAQKKAADCQTNLHMNFYGVTLGARGNLFGVSYGVGADGPDASLATQQALAGATSPPWVARIDNTRDTVDEIWHATMNSRGRYINATTPVDITNAMRDVLSSVGVAGGVSGSLAITGARISSNSLSVEPTFNRNDTDWYSDVKAYKPSRSSTGAIQYTSAWSASDKLAATTSRVILYGTSDGDSTPVVKDFVSAGPTSIDDLCANYSSTSCGPMTGTLVSSLGVTTSEAVAYLAGNGALEGTKLRKRSSKLGDIVNSSPVVSAPTDDFGYALLRKADGSYAYDPYKYQDYLEAKKNRPRVVYVGANDGMLHAFNGNDGVEAFGYIPVTAVGYLGNLLFPTSPNFQHRYLVDGPVAVSDAMFGTNDWRTVVVGTAGAGGRGVFGLDVSGVGTSTFNTSNVLWEVNDRITGAVGDRVGYVLGKPVIVPVRDSAGKPVWKAIFGGGYANRLNDADATRGTVTLFIVDMKTGAVDYIDAREAGVTTANGLGNIVAVDVQQVVGTAWQRGSDGMVDTVYGGDQNGNIWKFDLTKTGTARVALGGTPLFTAKDGTTTTAKRQAITGGFEAAAGPRGGVMLLFGTGSFSFDGDKQNSDVQTFYGVLDRPNETLTLPLGRSSLQAQTFDSAGVITRNTVDYFSSRGWYVDLAETASGALVKKGERMVGYPRLDAGVVYFPTYAPTVGDACSGGGSNFLYALSALSGAGGLGAVSTAGPNGTPMGENTGRVPLKTDGAAPVKDVNVFTTGKQSRLTGTPTNADVDKDKLAPEYCSAIISVSGAEPMYRRRDCGRQAWRQTR